MNLIGKQNIFTPKSLVQLQELITNGQALVITGAKTSTVLPFDSLKEVSWLDLSCLPKEVKIIDSHLVVTGPVTWAEARALAQSQNFDLMAMPTEESAYVLSGLATSATGELSFGFGAIRDHVMWLEYMDSKGESSRLESSQVLKEEQDEVLQEALSKYEKEYSPYSHFKNGPFPRFERATDLMVGTEGQLGVITKAAFKLRPKKLSDFLFINLPRWQEDYGMHLALFEYAQTRRGDIYSVELMDETSMNYLDKSVRPFEKGDVLFMEVDQDVLEDVYHELSDIQNFHMDQVLMVGHSKAMQMRLQIPRAINERNSRLGIIKKGTDAQVRKDKISLLLDTYREMAELGIDCILFGHFGDAHLHFNFLPTSEEVPKCDEALVNFYNKVHLLKGSPFAEHGIGLIKQKFMGPFYNENIKRVFYLLKKKYDPANKFFPMGYFNIKDNQ